MSRMFIPSTGECRLFDDIDFSEAAGTVRYSLEGVHYEIDLSADNLQELRSCLQPFIKYSRIVRRIIQPTPTPEEQGSS